MVVDLFMLYQFLKRLVSPFEKWEAYKLGIIDADGNVLKKRRNLGTADERKAWGYFDILAANLKKLLAQLPGGSSKIASYAAALLLLREHESGRDGSMLSEASELELKFQLMTIMEEIANVTGNSAGLDGDPPVKKKKKTYIFSRDLSKLKNNT